MNETDFAFRIRQALDESADSISYKASLRLERARHMAVARARDGVARTRPAEALAPALQLAAAGAGPLPAEGSGLWGWLRSAGLIAPLFALVAGFVGIYEWHHRSFINELADIDLAVLLDEAPLDAYADRGFGTMLERRAVSVAPEAAEPVATEETAAAEAASSDTASEPATTSGQQ
jgi:hypothetical protein